MSPNVGGEGGGTPAGLSTPDFTADTFRKTVIVQYLHTKLPEDTILEEMDLRLEAEL